MQTFPNLTVLVELFKILQYAPCSGFWRQNQQCRVVPLATCSSIPLHELSPRALGHYMNLKIQRSWHYAFAHLFYSDSLLQFVHPRERLKRCLDIVVGKPVQAFASQEGRISSSMYNTVIPETLYSKPTAQDDLRSRRNFGFSGT